MRVDLLLQHAQIISDHHNFIIDKNPIIPYNFLMLSSDRGTWRDAYGNVKLRQYFFGNGGICHAIDYRH
jgi:hypothetical protein